MSGPYQVPRKTATTVTVNATATAGYHTPVDATAGALTITLPTTMSAGAHLVIEKVDASANKVTVSGTIRGTAATVTLDYRYETLELLAETTGSWRITSNHLPKSAVDAKIAAQAVTYDGTNLLFNGQVIALSGGTTATPDLVLLAETGDYLTLETGDLLLTA